LADVADEEALATGCVLGAIDARKRVEGLIFSIDLGGMLVLY
jgi:hypothetical protein